ncbi:MAG: D-alanine--poly(phosphoribitol) ligase subunit DltC [Lachnospiraceae bacterium]|nr:D-alanine--poly(phosphoribitol) ligase subunit DltC [Lachnospiraceae bacterium]
MEEKILEILAEACEDDSVKENLDVELFDSDLLDSLGFAELLAELDDELGVVIAPSEVNREDMNTPRKIIELVKERKASL